MSLDVEVIDDSLWATTVADRLGGLADQATRLCLATGHTVEPVYTAVNDLQGATIFLLDEFGGLPGDDPARCESMIRSHLTGHLLSDSPLHVPDVDDPNRAEAAERYRLSISAGIDLAVVGLGLNGHIGMNEPGTDVSDGTRVVDLHPETSRGALAYGATKSPSWGITVGFAELMEARELWLLVTGTQKAGVLQRTLNGPVGPAIPGTYLRLHRNARLMADRSAVGQG